MRVKQQLAAQGYWESLTGKLPGTASKRHSAQSDGQQSHDQACQKAGSHWHPL